MSGAFSNELVAGSTNTLLYSPHVDGLPVVLDVAPVVEVYNSYGGLVISGSSSYNSSLLGYTFILSGGTVSVGSVGDIWASVWYWEYGSNTLRDVDKHVVVDSGLSSLVMNLRSRIRDRGDTAVDYFNGDGVSVVFESQYSPIRPSSLRVFVGNTLMTSGYSADYGNGSVTFTSAPTTGTQVRFNYIAYRYLDSELEDFVIAGILDMNRALAYTVSTSNPSMTDDERNLALLFSVREVYVHEALSSAKSGFAWRDEEKSINKSGLVSNYKMAIELLESKIKGLVSDHNMSAIGHAYSGGAELVLFNDIDWDNARA